VAAIKSHIGDNILVRLCEKLQIPITAPAKQEIDKITKHAENEATHKATEKYMKMKAQGRRISMGVRELEKAWSAVHGKDSYAYGEKTIDYSGLAAASTLELGLGAVLPSSRARAMNPSDVANMVKCPICNDRLMLRTSMKSHMKSKKHKEKAAAAAARGQAGASPAEPVQAQAQAQSQPTVMVAVPTPVSIAVPTPEPVATPAHVRLATGSSHNAIVESAAFQAAMANFNAARLVALRAQNNGALSEELAALEADI
jgi:hypothetical protein